MTFDPYVNWARAQFDRYMGCVAYVETTDHQGINSIGTAFHVGDGVFVTARHVVENRRVTTIGFADRTTEIVVGPYVHQTADVDVACFRVKELPSEFVPLGGHLDDWIGGYEFILHRTLVLGYPPIPTSDRPVPVASMGEINATVDR
jgi:hypothetical protein